jgi:hypothetical protein
MLPRVSVVDASLYSSTDNQQKRRDYAARAKAESTNKSDKQQYLAAKVLRCTKK